MRTRLFPARALTLIEVPAPVPQPWERAAMDSAWDEAVRRNPALFDGPVAGVTGLIEPGDGRVVVQWARTTYRNFSLRSVEGARSWLPSLFVVIAQPTDDGRLLVGRMSGSTAAPGRWQLPGGTVEPPPPAMELTSRSVRGHAAVELREEIGAPCGPQELSPWTGMLCPNGNVGVLFRAPARPWEELRAGFEALQRSEQAAARESEFAQVDALAGPQDLQGRHPVADHLPVAADLFFASS